MKKQDNKEQSQSLLVFDDIQLLSIQDLKIGRSYQRAVEPSRVERIYRKMKKRGYVPAYPVIVNQSMFVIDGQHRIIAAQKMGFLKIPVCVVHCDTIQQEIELFTEFNEDNTRLSPVVLWYARNMLKHPLANAVHFLNVESKSLFKDRIAERGHVSKARFSISEMLDIMIGVLFDISQKWDTDKDKTFCERLEKISTDVIIQQMNHFAKWLFDCFGEDKQYGILAYTHHSLRALVHFYVRLRRTNFFKDAKDESSLYKDAIKKMKKFVFPPQWKTFSHAARMAIIVEHWNHKRRDYRIEFLPGEKEELID